MVLLDVSKGKKVRITGFIGGANLVNKLRQIGLQPGISVQVLRQAPPDGPFLIQVGDRTIVLERAIIAKIQVEEVDRMFFRLPNFFGKT